MFLAGNFLLISSATFAAVQDISFNHKTHRKK